MCDPALGHRLWGHLARGGDQGRQPGIAGGLGGNVAAVRWPSNQILIIRTAQDIHAYNYTSEQWATNVGVRYVDPVAGVTPPAWP
jgi:hypothetical protein